MSQVNARTPVLRTHNGAVAKSISAEARLRRSVMSCMLWEDQFYEDGATIASRIESLVSVLPDHIVANIAIESREKQNLRHVPLLLVRMLAKNKSKIVAATLERVIQRADELTEFLAIYWKDGKQPLSAQVKKGLARAFCKFNAYQLAKYNRDNAVKLQDVLFLSHAKPKDEAQEETWKKLIAGTLESPDTWEVALSAGADKKETFERLIGEGKLGALALLRNLRNMQGANVSDKIIRDALRLANADRILPFRFIAAARHAPSLEDVLEQLMMKCLSGFEKLNGKTIIIVDNSGSMYGTKVSVKSDMTRSDAACALAIMIREICDDPVVIGFGDHPAVIAPRHGFALAEAIKAGPGGFTNTDHALALAEAMLYDRIIVITDEQSNQTIRNPISEKAYFINVASAQNGIGYGKWVHFDGWSESIIEYIVQYEKAGM